LSRFWIPLIDGPTPVARLSSLGREWRHEFLFVKREDATDHRYGGNKVRNLEFLLGQALARKERRLVTIGPLGSNFVAALAAQSRRVGLPVDVHQFVPELTVQIRRHADFSRRAGARLHVQEGPLALGLARAGARFAWQVLRDGSFPIPVGGSSWLGALGHARAALELSGQISRGGCPEPDFLVVGAGTCGTMAGLLVGLRVAGLRTRVIGVRCVDRVVCNRRKIAALATRISRELGLGFAFSPGEVDLRDAPGPGVRYGAPIEEARELSRLFLETEGLELDTTYTTKVAAFLRGFVRAEENRTARILYWHTFSPAAMRSASHGPRAEVMTESCTHPLTQPRRILSFPTS
jgi:D-cysteine desulfhydrase